jgi:hypothetical protein
MRHRSAKLVAQHTSMEATILCIMVSKIVHRVNIQVTEADHTTVSVTNGVGVQLRGGGANEGPWVEKHRGKLAAARGTDRYGLESERPSCWTGSLRGIVNDV